MTPPCESDEVRFYNDLQDRGDCLSTRKTYKASHFVGRVCGLATTLPMLSRAPARFELRTAPNIW